MNTTLISASELAARIDDPAVVIVDCRHDLMNLDAGREALRGRAYPQRRVRRHGNTRCRAPSAAPTASSAAAIRCPSAPR